MIEQIQLQNFKVARDIDVRLAPLTVLAGLNGSGKSTLLQSLSCLRQSYGSGTRGLVLGGELVQLGQGRDVISDGTDSGDAISISIKESNKTYSWKCVYKDDANLLEFSKKPKKKPNFIVTPDFQYLQADRIVPSTLYPQAQQQARDAGFLGAHGQFTMDYLARNEKDVVSAQRRFRRKELHKSVGLPPNLELLNKVAPTDRLLDQVSGWLQYLSPGACLTVEKIPGTDEVRLQYSYAGRHRSVKIGNYRPTNVGFGLTYSLPILVATLAAKQNALLLLENPEAHIHPQGQAVLGELLACAASDGVQIIVETHSDHLLNGIRLAVKHKILSHDRVALHFFTRPVDTGESYVQSPDIFSDGTLSNWPDGFFDQWDKSLDNLLG